MSIEYTVKARKRQKHAPDFKKMVRKQRYEEEK
jgi:hypothetical protein